MNDTFDLGISKEQLGCTQSQRISALEGHLLYNYLLRLSFNEIQDEIKIEYILGTSNIQSLSFERPSYNYDVQLQSYTATDRINICKLLYNDSEYFLTISKYSKGDEHHGIAQVVFDISIYNYKVIDKKIDIIQLLLIKSKQHSVFAKKILRLHTDLLSNLQVLDCVEIIEPKNVLLDDIYIPKLKKEQCERFIKAVKNYEKERCVLRYLFNGAPGTAKTQLINAIMNELNGTVNFFVMGGAEISLTEVFNFVRQFEKCVLVIDDLDLVVGNRDNRTNYKDMAVFLSTLDGHLPNSLFLLASTNDKKLVDLAASRPGRFDMILDIDAIDNDNYMSLIKRETDDDEILSFFNTNILEMFLARKVTGAYIVSFIKQLKNLKYTNGILTSEDFNNYLNLTYNGFYKSNSDNLKAVGF
jgi:predicted AAA+ superfamily ATPase